MQQRKVTAIRLGVMTSVLSVLAACGGDGSSGPGPEESRPHDARNSFVAPTAPFAAMDPATGGSAVATDRWTGVLNGAGYQIEVPKTTWNGKLVMWAHGYNGTGNALTVFPPIMRKYLLDNGYAWAASSYTKNFYDVRAGVEDTNALALNFTRLAATNGRTLTEPTKFFITGVSMGGHITAAAIEDETAATANNKVRYSGAVPLCGVVGDTSLANYFGGYQLAAQALAGLPASKFPVSEAEWTAIAPVIRSALWATFPTVSNAQGNKLKTVVQQLSGGDRPFYNEGWADAGNQGNLWASIGGDGTFSGILTGNIVDTTQIVYKVDASAPGPTALDNFFNASILKISPAPDANKKRSDGLRWIPVINGEFSVPVVSLHTLGDLFVPFKMEQVYATRAKAKGNDKWLVQRAIRDVGHCAFTAAEAAAAFDAMVKWEAGGPKPAGDDVLTPSVVADPKYGCAFTVNTPSTQDFTAPAVRAGHQAKYPACS
ncbi:MAG: alpha/beta hydrolase [Burkholderiaceae bacterium]|nr:alpha/beta hydrolase [Burkholderiaceae bacterium]MBP7660690.1 alpha/beta hydrolase [Burkholderiaceae bacterium]